MPTLILILGAYNDEKGQLSPIAISRLNQGIREFYETTDGYFILTGGYGPHFNPTQKAHALYAKEFLLTQGIPEKRILALIESRFTLEDAQLSKQKIDRFDFKKIIVVTSDYHMPRVKKIFHKVFSEYKLSYSTAQTIASSETLDKLKREEEKKLLSIKEKF